MKYQINPALMAILFSLVLVACGGDKSEPTKTESTPKPVAEVKVDTEPTNPKPTESGDTQSEESKSEESKPKEPKTDASKAEVSSDTTAPKSEVKTLSLEEGKVRYEKTCKICHEQGLFDSPKLTDKANWAKRLEKGVDTLHAHSAKGFNKMPAQATGDVSEAEVHAAVDYMISQVKK